MSNHQLTDIVLVHLMLHSPHCDSEIQEVDTQEPSSRNPAAAGTQQQQEPSSSRNPAAAGTQQMEEIIVANTAHAPAVIGPCTCGCSHLWLSAHLWLLAHLQLLPTCGCWPICSCCPPVTVGPPAAVAHLWLLANRNRWMLDGPPVNCNCKRVLFTGTCQFCCMCMGAICVAVGAADTDTY